MPTSLQPASQPATRASYANFGHKPPSTVVCLARMLGTTQVPKGARQRDSFEGDAQAYSRELANRGIPGLHIQYIIREDMATWPIDWEWPGVDAGAMD